MPSIPAAFLRCSVPTFSGALGLLGVALHLSTQAARSRAVEHSSQQPDDVLESTYYA